MSCFHNGDESWSSKQSREHPGRLRHNSLLKFDFCFVCVCGVKNIKADPQKGVPTLFHICSTFPSIESWYHVLFTHVKYSYNVLVFSVQFAF